MALDNIARGLGANAKKIADNAQQRIDNLPKGLIYKGSVATEENLPEAKEANKGWLYTTLNNGHEHVSDGSQWVDLSADLNGKLDKPTEPVPGEGVNVPYYFEVNYDANKAVVKDYTIDLLDKNKAPQQFSLDINSATIEKAGLMTAADKIKLNAAITDISGKQDKLIAGANITIAEDGKTISAAGGINPQFIELTFYEDGETGALTDEQAQILLASELNYIWLNGMHRLDFRYRDDNNNKANYSAADSSSDGNKIHSVEINLTTKEFKVYHKTLQEYISDLETIRSGAALGSTAIQEHQSIKSINGNSLVGSGNVIVTTYKPFPSSWPHTFGTTIASFCAAVNASYKAGEIKIGDAFLGNINSPAFFSGAYVEGGSSLGSAEVSVQIMTPFGQNCVQLLTTTSSNNAPYHWEYTFVDGATTEGWRSWGDMRANPSEIPTQELTKLSLNGTVYSISSIPQCPTGEDGIFELKATVSGGFVNYEWVLK